MESNTSKDQMSLKAIKLQEMDTKLSKDLTYAKKECNFINKVLLPLPATQINALENMGKLAIKELQTVPETHQLDASMDVMHYFVEELEKLKFSLSAIKDRISNVERFATSSYYDTHNGMLPYMSQEELDCINAVSYFIPRAST